MSIFTICHYTIKACDNKALGGNVRNHPKAKKIKYIGQKIQKDVQRDMLYPDVYTEGGRYLGLLRYLIL